MRTIYKYPFDIKKEVYITPPAGSELLKIGLQGDQPTAWFIVDTKTKQSEIRKFLIFGTGHELPEYYTSLTYHGTIMTDGDSLVWHIFEQH